MPSRAIASGARLRERAAVERDLAGLRTAPEIARSVVVLPAPFAPSSATTSPSSTVERDAVQAR